MKAFRIDFAEAGNSKRYRENREIPIKHCRFLIADADWRFNKSFWVARNRKYLMAPPLPRQSGNRKSEIGNAFEDYP
jgi:hypothetical protein